MHRQGFAGENVSIGPRQTGQMNFSTGPRNDVSPTELTEEELDDLRIELMKTEDEIQTLRQVLLAKEKYASDIKKQLGLDPLSNIKQNLSKGWQDVQCSTPYITASATLDDISRSDAYKRTQETFSHVGQVTTAALSNVGMAITRRLAEMRALPLPAPPRHSSTFKSFEEMVGGMKEKVTGGSRANTSGFSMS